jgi:hypothetical protein
MSGGERRDQDWLRAAGARARARAEEQRALEGPGGDPDRILAALDAQARRAPARASGRRAAFGWIAAGALPLAAAAAFVVGSRASSPTAHDASAGDYVVSITGHVQAERGAGDGVYGALEARPDAVEEVILRPRARASRPVTAKILVVRDGAESPLDVPTDVSEAGAVRFEVPGATLAGASELRVRIGTVGDDDARTVRVPIEPPPRH